MAWGSVGGGGGWGMPPRQPPAWQTANPYAGFVGGNMGTGQTAPPGFVGGTEGLPPGANVPSPVNPYTNLIANLARTVGGHLGAWSPRGQFMRPGIGQQLHGALGRSGDWRQAIGNMAQTLGGQQQPNQGFIGSLAGAEAGGPGPMWNYGGGLEPQMPAIPAHALNPNPVQTNPAEHAFSRIEHVADAHNAARTLAQFMASRQRSRRGGAGFRSLNV